MLLPTLSLKFPWYRNTVLHLGLCKHSKHSLMQNMEFFINTSAWWDHVPHRSFRCVLRSSWGSHQLSDLEYEKISSSPICKILCDEELILLPCFSQDYGKLLLNPSDAPLNAVESFAVGNGVSSGARLSGGSGDSDNANTGMEFAIMPY